MSENPKIELGTLSPEDAAAADAALERGGVSHQTPDPARQARVQAWLKVVGTGEAPVAPADMATRTMAAVRNAPHPFPAEQKAASGAPARAPTPWKRRLAEGGAMAIAAALLVAVTLQSLDQVHRSKLRVACAANLSRLSTSFSAYGQYCGEELPALALPANNNWLYGNSPDAARNNTANLIPLVNHNFAPRSAFYCPGAEVQAPPPGAALINELPAITYSYRNLYGPERVTWDGQHETLVMADKNPLFTTDAKTTAGGQDVNSPNHRGQGNYVLRADGTVTWETNPNIGPDHDNIWTIGTGKDMRLTYTGTEVPASVADVMMSP